MTTVPDESPRFHDFKVINHDPTFRKAEVWMDGEQLRGVTAVSTALTMHDAQTITLTIICGSLNAEETP